MPMPPPAPLLSLPLSLLPSLSLSLSLLPSLSLSVLPSHSLLTTLPLPLSQPAPLPPRPHASQTPEPKRHVPDGVQDVSGQRQLEAVSGLGGLGCSLLKVGSQA
eukprot:3522015-Rhodomonas_salina.1